ncbi:MAG: hypothetical protein H6718_32935 [Polyangiaceae bacterium]|nr:hypothetical protein [Polyangiaceae bacterium]MCB9605081.1 hypothetical protein [Polyangiaceae bacterium]
MSGLSRRRWLGAATALATASWWRPAHAARELTTAERAQLAAGAQVRRRVDFQNRSGDYVGGLSYQRIASPPRRVVERLQHVAAVRAVLPRVISARRLPAPADQHRFELVQGTSLYSARYSVIALRPKPQATEVRFWLDPREEHEIDDVWGFFRAQPFQGGSMISVGVALNLGEGIIRWLFEERIVDIMLDMPRRIRDYVDA